jgi:glycosyltransferase involved in cell wall biosynthesis
MDDIFLQEEVEKLYRYEKQSQKKLKQPDVSILLPTYNRPKTLERSLRSLLNQEVPTERYQILVLNDGSERETEEVIQNLRKEERGRIIHHLYFHHTALPSIMINFASKIVRTDLLGFAFDDDMVYPNYLRVLLDAWGNGKVAGVLGLTEDIFKGRRIEIYGGGELSFEKQRQKNNFPLHSLLIKRSVFLSLGGLDEDPRMQSKCDWDFGIRLLRKDFKVIQVPEIVARWNSDNMDGLLRRRFSNPSWQKLVEDYWNEKRRKEMEEKQ